METYEGLQGMIDTHFHSRVMRQKGVDPGEHLKRAFAEGLVCAVDIGTELGDLEERSGLVAEFDRVYMAAGLYPSYAGAEDLPSLVAELETSILEHQAASIRGQRPRLVAVGECGIDLHWDFADTVCQQELLELQIDLADRLDLPVVIHSREADDPLLEVFRRHSPKRGGILHCFSSGPEMMRRCLDLGFFISFAGNLTFKNAELIRSSALQVPMDRLLFETDSPYLSPEPMRGRPNHPAFVAHTYRFFSRLRSVPMEELISQVAANVHRIFSLP